MEANSRSEDCRKVWQIVLEAKRTTVVGISMESIKELFSIGSSMDPTVRVQPRQLRRLRTKFVPAERFSKDRMFANMAASEISILRGTPVRVKQRAGKSKRDALVQSLRAFGPHAANRVQIGPSQRVVELSVREIMRRWTGGRAIIGVTDLHIRGTPLDRVINTNSLCDFNLLLRGSESLSRQEMMTLVIASPGNVSDSHSDDPEGSNHCFMGKKLWLVWDVFEGMSAGLEDVSRQDVFARARFDMERFVSLPSSRWCLVQRGDTLFLPGRFSHKVITLEPYLGVGSFHVGLPSCLETLGRWIEHGPLWSIDDPLGDNDGLVDEAVQVALRVACRVRAGSTAAKRRWGYSHFRRSEVLWRKRTSRTSRDRLMSHDGFAALVDTARSSLPARALKSRSAARNR